MGKIIQPYSSIFFILIMVVSTGCSALSGSPVAASSNSNQALTASGIIEADQVNAAAELSGRVVVVNVTEGQTVKAGDVLFSLDDSLLKAQRQAAQAALDAAQKEVLSAQAGLNTARLQHEQVLLNALAAEQSGRSATWKQTKPSVFDLPTWYFASDERYQSTLTAVDEAKTALDLAQSNLESTRQKAGSAQFLDAEKRLSDARIGYILTQSLLDKTNGASSGQDLRNAAQTVLDDAKKELDQAQKAYDESLTTDGAKDVLKARAQAAIAQERYDMAQDALRSMQTGERAPEVASAANAVQQAQAAVDQAQAQVTQAQANLDLMDVQISKLNVLAPLDGVVLALSIHPGEVLQAGMTALSLGRLDHLKVTVYLPEDRYGTVKLGQETALLLDSFPNETFKATVTRIADQAEFTPRNVQTQEQRQTTVYAVELSLDNPDGKLKPGMPVDVTFTP